MSKPAQKKQKTPTLHPRNLHQGRYDFSRLCKDSPSLAAFLRKNPKGEATIDFSNPKAVVALNQALLKTYYGIDYWAIPKQALCPPIPGRADYIHHLADLLRNQFDLRSPKQANVSVLDIGTGASLIYPILGRQLYQWQFVASDVSKDSLISSQAIIDENPGLAGHINLVHQADSNHIFQGVIQPGEFFHLTLCNPPFHASKQEAEQGSQRKVANLKKPVSGKVSVGNKSQLNFGGQSNELWCPGGERAFISRMIRESEAYKAQVGWFSCLISKAENLPALKKTLKKGPVKDMKVIKMAQGQKVSRFLAWTYLSPEALKHKAPLQAS